MTDEPDSADYWKSNDPTERTPNQKLNADAAEHETHRLETVAIMTKVWLAIQARWREGR